MLRWMKDTANALKGLSLRRGQNYAGEQEKLQRSISLFISALDTKKNKNPCREFLLWACLQVDGGFERPQIKPLVCSEFQITHEEAKIIQGYPRALGRR